MFEAKADYAPAEVGPDYIALARGERVIRKKLSRYEGGWRHVQIHHTSESDWAPTGFLERVLGEADWNPCTPSVSMANSIRNKSEWRQATEEALDILSEQLAARMDNALFCMPCWKRIVLPPKEKCADADTLKQFIDHLQGVKHRRVVQNVECNSLCPRSTASAAAVVVVVAVLVVVVVIVVVVVVVVVVV